MIVEKCFSLSVEKCICVGIKDAERDVVGKYRKILSQEDKWLIR